MRVADESSSCWLLVTPAHISCSWHPTIAWASVNKMKVSNLCLTLFVTGKTMTPALLLSLWPNRRPHLVCLLGGVKHRLLLLHHPTRHLEGTLTVLAFIQRRWEDVNHGRTL